MRKGLAIQPPQPGSAVPWSMPLPKRSGRQSSEKEAAMPRGTPLSSDGWHWPEVPATAEELQCPEDMTDEQVAAEPFILEF